MVGLTGAASTRTRCLLALMLAPSVLANTLPQEFIQNAEDALIATELQRSLQAASSYSYEYSYYYEMSADTPVPTVAPGDPTAAPTVFPGDPTAVPVPAPTAAPTVAPGDPTAAPTVFPGDPTAVPVPAPTNRPTSAATAPASDGSFSYSYSSYSYDCGAACPSDPTTCDEATSMSGFDSTATDSYAGCASDCDMEILEYLVSMHCIPSAVPVPAPTPEPTFVPTPAPTLAECTNGALDTAIGETDVDCGGDNCPPCGLNEVCAVDSDCFTGGSCIGLVCLYTPTAVPIPVPTGTPTPAPTRVPIVAVAVGMSGVTCAEYDTDSGDDVITTVLDTIITGSVFSDPECSAGTDDDSISVALEVSATIPTYTTAGYDSLFLWVNTELTAVVSDGTFTTAIVNEASRRRLSWARRLSLSEATVTGVTTETFSPSPAPSPAPTTAAPSTTPTPAPTMTMAPSAVPVPAPTAGPGSPSATPVPAPTAPPKKKSEDDDSAALGLGLGLGLGIPFLLIVAYGVYFQSERNKSEPPPPGPTPTYSDPMVANPGAVELGVGGGYSEDEPNNELASHMVAGGRWLEA